MAEDISGEGFTEKPKPRRKMNFRDSAKAAGVRAFYVTLAAVFICSVLVLLKSYVRRYD
jgi:hypothetical protein